MHDAWLKAGVHYIALFAYYNKVILTWSKALGRHIESYEPTFALLSVAPIAGKDDEEEEEYCSDNESDPGKELSAQFTAEAYVTHFEKLCDEYYELNLRDWAVCCPADNAPVNKKVTKLLDIYDVGCKNHLLNLEVERMITLDEDLTDACKSVHTTMVDLKGSLKNTALLNDLTHLKPQLHNKTRWSGKKMEFSRWMALRNEIRSVKDDDESGTLHFNGLQAFLNRVTKYSKHFNEINVVTKSLQTSLIKLRTCQKSLDILYETIQLRKNDPESHWFECTLDNHYISPDSKIIERSKHFESGVVKIQGNKFGDLTNEERQACTRLLLPAAAPPVQGDASSSDDETGSPDMQRLLKESNDREERDNTIPTSPYYNIDFICGSVAEVERLWSVASYILTDERQSMTPQMFEALLYLKTNKRLWGISEVCSAMRHAGSERSAQRLERQLKQVKLLDE